MMHPTDHRLNAALQGAMIRIRSTATAAAERAVDSLGIAAMSAAHTKQRDGYLSAQFELRRKLPEFNLRFGDVLIERVSKEISPSSSGRSLASTDWHSLSLVGDDEVEELVSADRLGHTITEECEWELREVAAYMGSLLRTGRAELERNPLRPEVIGKALYRAIECVSDQNETRKLLGRELGRSMAQSMRSCYTEIVKEFQMRGVHPVGLAVKTVEGPGNDMPRYNTGYDSGFHGSGFHGSGYETGGPSSRFTSTPDEETFGLPTAGTGAGITRPSRMSGGRGSGWGGGPTGQTFGTIDPHMMELIRRLAFLGVDFDPGPSTGGAPTTRPSPGRASGSVFDLPGTGLAGPGLMAANLILQHRDELAQASTGALDHMVIDVVGGLFDQILSDPKVPPQMARQIARLQLPVLRVALGDVTFFSSRRHPVRRFVNRIASLACAFEDFSEGPGLAFIVQVRNLVQQIVEGDFEQMDLYDSKLDALEQFIAQLTAKDMQAHGSTATLLDDKDHELRLQQRYMQALKASLGPLPIPDFMRDFLAQVWSQAVMRTVQRDGANAQSTQRFRRAGRELVMSVQPKGSPTHRKAFLLKLPQLMKDLNEGLNLIGWPEAAKKSFFAMLSPAHAESLKGEPLSELSYNMLVKDVDAALAVPVPTADDVAASRHEAIPELSDTVFENRFSPEEAQLIGLVPESAVDWDGTVDIDIGGGDTEPIELDIDIDGLPPAESPEPTRGKSLMDHVQLGFAYQMHLNDAWQKVRLSHVSPGRAFFVFTRGKKHHETISMTSRMLARMCETGRLRAFENAYLIERATARARKQLAALTASTSKH